MLVSGDGTGKRTWVADELGLKAWVFQHRKWEWFGDGMGVGVEVMAFSD